MAHCTKCGASLNDGSAFCGSCGAANGDPAVARTSTSGVAVAAAPTAAGTGLTMNLAAALSYALGAITGAAFLVLDPYKTDPFVRFHAMQSVLFSVACIVVSIAWSIVVGILVSVAGFWVLTFDVPLRLLFGLGIFGLWLYVMFQAYSQREFRIPFIGDFAAKHAH